MPKVTYHRGWMPNSYMVKVDLGNGITPKFVHLSRGELKKHQEAITKLLGEVPEIDTRFKFAARKIITA